MRFSGRHAVFTAILAASVAGADEAHAEPAPAASATSGTQAKDRALDLFERSELAYEEGRFSEAIAFLNESYALNPEPVLLYNLGRAYEGLADLVHAAEAYEAFLKAVPSTPDRGALEKRIATLRVQIAERQALVEAAKARRTDPPRAPTPVPWIVAGVGVAGVGVGAVLGVLANGRHDDAVAEPTYVKAEELQVEAQSLATAATICFVAGAVIAGVGVAWGIQDVMTSRGRTQASALVTF